MIFATLGRLAFTVLHLGGMRPLKTNVGATLLANEMTLLLEKQLPRAEKAKAIAEAIRASGDYRWTGVYDVDEEKGVVSNIAWSGSGAPQYPVFSITKGLTSRAIATKRTVNVGDVASDADYLTALATTQSEIIIPVLSARGDKCGRHY